MRHVEAFCVLVCSHQMREFAMHMSVSYKHVVRLAGFCVIVMSAVPAWAHHTDESVLRAPDLPAQSAPIETVSGMLDDLIVENRVSNTTTRYVSLHQADGETITLSGGALDAF